MKKSLQNLAKNSNKALILGIGGGGDIVGTIPTSKFLENLGVETIVGGVTWERSVKDPEPGPRKIEELKKVEKISKCSALANPETETKDGIVLTEAAVSEVLDEKTFLLDLNYGVDGAVKGIEKACRDLDIDLVVGLDVGGDVLGTGQEEGLESMLSDAMVLSALMEIDEKAILGVLGLGADGEISIEELLENSSSIAKNNGYLGARGITPDVRPIMKEAIENTETEASALSLKGAEGSKGDLDIRGGRRKVDVSLITSITFYFDPRVVSERINTVSKKISNTESIVGAQEIMDDEGISTEYDYEKGLKKEKVE